MTNIENETPVEDGQAPETEAAAAAEAPAQDEAAKLAEQLAAVQQDLLYARAETQNVRRRAEKEVADAHAYAATKFARDILSVADNLGRALASLSEEQRADEAIKPPTASRASPRSACRSIRTSIRRCSKSPATRTPARSYRKCRLAI